VHEQEEAGNLSHRSPFSTSLFAEDDWCMTDALVKEATEGSEALEPNFKADVSYSDLVSLK
jgi:hypothetical protein